MLVKNFATSNSNKVLPYSGILVAPTAVPQLSFVLGSIELSSSEDEGLFNSRCVEPRSHAAGASFSFTGVGSYCIISKPAGENRRIENYQMFAETRDRTRVGGGGGRGGSVAEYLTDI